MSRIVIENGRVVDPASRVDGPRTVAIEDGRIAALVPPGERLGADAWGGATRIDARGRWVLPGLIDLHVHFREPGEEYKETIASGLAAAAAGGFTRVVTMPNTKPANDCRAVTELQLEAARAAAGVHLHAAGAVTKGLGGETLSEMGELAEAGCVAFTDDGRPIMDAELMRRALEYAQRFGKPVAVHAEDLRLTGRGVMHEGRVSTRLGLPGIPSASESSMVARDLELTELTGGRLHVCHVSAARTVALIRDAKNRGLRVTAEVTPHHLVLTDSALESFDTSAKCAPPLRSDADRAALREGLRDGTLDAVATDHAPHSALEKECELDHASNGSIGLETALGAALEVYRAGDIELPVLIARLTCGPAAAYGLPGGTLATGAPADVTIVDPERRWVVEPSRFRSKARNCPFAGRELTGFVTHTLVGGRVIFEAAPR